MKALIVDDDRVLADVVGFALRREGFDVIQAYDGVIALQRWMEEHPELIILDVNLPKMDGFTVCQRIRRESDVPIILLTVRGEDEDVVHGLEIGANDYITKPFSPRQLVSARSCRAAPGAAALSACAQASERPVPGSQPAGGARGAGRAGAAHAAGGSLAGLPDGQRRAGAHLRCDH